MRWGWFLRSTLFILFGLLPILACSKEKPTAADTQPPMVEVTFPEGNSSVSGLVVITVEAKDDGKVVRVEFYIDEVLRFTDEESPWEYTWETLFYANGSKHSITAQAFDGAGNSASSEKVNVVVYNEINEPPTAIVLMPEDSASFVLGEEVTFMGEGRDALGNVLREDQLTWFSSLDDQLGTGSQLTRDDLSSGWHTISLIATDDDGLMGKDSTVINVSDEAELFQVTHDPSLDVNPCWSSDGQHIAFASNRSGNFDIWVVPAGGGDPEPLTVDLAEDWDPAWYESEVAFTSFRSGNADIWKIPDTGGEPQQVTTHQGWDTGACWSPDGEQIVVSSQMGGGAQNLWVLPLGDGDTTQLTTRPAYAPDWSWGDIAFHSGDQNIYVTSLSVMEPIQITWDPARDVLPNWSPDGDAIVFTSDRGGNEDIWIWSFGESQFQQVTYYSGRDYDPAWSPNGQWIAFASDRSGNPDIWIIRAQP